MRAFSSQPLLLTTMKSPIISAIILMVFIFVFAGHAYIIGDTRSATALGICGLLPLIFFGWLLFEKIQNIRCKKYLAKRKAYDETGVERFALRALGYSDIAECVNAELQGMNRYSASLMWQQKREAEKKETEVTGMVAGEEVVGVVQNRHLFVTCCTQEALNAFEALPGDLRQRVTVISAVGT